MAKRALQLNPRYVGRTKAMTVSEHHYPRFREALREADVGDALYALAVSLKNEGATQVQLYELFTWFLQRLSPEHPRIDALQETMDAIYGGAWGKGRALFPTEVRVERSLPAVQAPWVEIVRGDTALEREAVNEMGPNHQLWGSELIAIARRLDCDHVLFALRGRAEVAEVHLTWSGLREPDGLPTTCVFSSMLEWHDDQAGYLEQP